MRTRPLLLDLFCGAGGAAMGYHRAGFDVVGVDLSPQPHYPFPFIQGDALRPPVRLEMFDVIHASPPCQAYSVTKHTHDKSHPELLGDTRDMLMSSGKPYVIENVVGAPMLAPVTLCGSSFGLGVRRHRLFESSEALLVPNCDHASQGRPMDVTGGGGTTWNGQRKANNAAEASDAMGGMAWASKREITQAIPPAYTEHIGRQLIDAMTNNNPEGGQ